MKRLVWIGLFIIWLLGATLWLNHWWQTHVDLVPTPPPAFSNWWLDMYGANGCEDAADAELLFTLATSFIVASVATALCLSAWKRLTRRLAQEQWRR